MSDLNEWEEIEKSLHEKSDVSTADIDAAISKMQEKRREYDAKKKISNDAEAEFDKAQQEVMRLLKEAGKSKYHVDGLGTVSIRNKYMVRVPKGLTEKCALFQYIEEKYGSETLVGLQTINYASLNSFVNAEKESDPQAEIPGIEQPVHEEILAFRSGK